MFRSGDWALSYLPASVTLRSQQLEWSTIIHVETAYVDARWDNSTLCLLLVILRGRVKSFLMNTKIVEKYRDIVSKKECTYEIAFLNL